MQGKSSYVLADGLDTLEVAGYCIPRMYSGMTAETRDGRHIMILRAWIDDTGDDSIFALGGLIGPLKVWDNFSRMWIKKLKERPRLGFYKTNYAMGLKRDFKGWSSDARNSKVAKLASCIPTRNCCGITSLLYRSDYDELVVGKCEFEPEFRSPYYVCALYLVACTCRTFNRASKIDFVFDKQGHLGEGFREIFDVVLKPLFPCLGECFYWNDQEFPPLQAADMNVAWMRRNSSPEIQMWTSADIYLSRLRQQDYPITRQFLLGLAELRTEQIAHARAFFQSHGSKRNP